MAWLNFHCIKFPSVSRRIIYVIFFFINFVICANGGQICVQKRDPPLQYIGTHHATSFYSFLRVTKLFVDRTEFITRIADDKSIINDGVDIIAFPRRFGKTLNMLLLQFFFGIEVHPNGKEVSQEDTISYQFFTTGKFNDYNGDEVKFEPAPQISALNYRKIVQTHCAKYPVIYIDFKPFSLVPIDTYDDFLKMFGEMIQVTFESHVYLEEYLSNKLDTAPPYKQTDAADNLNFFMDGKRNKLDSHMLATSIQTLSKILRERFSNRKVIIIIDEYDMIITQVYLHDKQLPVELKENIIGFLDRFYKLTLTNNGANYHRVILTGLLNIQLGTIFSGLNYPRHYNMFSVEVNHFYGISAAEADQLFNYYSIESEQREIVRNYYDGYTFPTMNGFGKFYNPHSIVSYLNNLKNHVELGAYWSGTGVIDGNIYTMMMIDSVKNKLQPLLSDNSSSVIIHHTFTGNFMTAAYLEFSIKEIRSLEEMSNSQSNFQMYADDNHADTFLKLLIATGYLTWDGKDSKSKLPGFILPNIEVSEHILLHYVNDYKGRFGYTYTHLATELQEFLFDDNLESEALKKAFTEFAKAHQHELLPHFPPSESKTTVTPTGENSAIEVNEAYFASVLRAVAFYIKNEKTFVAFEHKVVGGYLDLYFHNYVDKQAIIELKYQGAHKNIDHAKSQIAKYKTKLNYKYKYIAVLGKTDGSIDVKATFDIKTFETLK